MNYYGNNYQEIRNAYFSIQPETPVDLQYSNITKPQYNNPFHPARLLFDPIIWLLGRRIFNQPCNPLFDHSHNSIVFDFTYSRIAK